MKFYLKLMFIFLIFALGFIALLGFKSYVWPVLLGHQQRFVATTEIGIELDAQKLEVLQITNNYIFPYDFMQKPYPKSWSVLLLKNPIYYRGQSDAFNVIFYEEMKKIGVDLASQPESFLLLKAEVQMGFDLREPGVVFEQKKTETDSVLNVTLKAPKVLGIDLEVSSSPKGWPSMFINPEEWALLSQFLQNEIEKTLLNEENFDLIKGNTESLLKNLFATQGFQSINFMYQI